MTGFGAAEGRVGSSRVTVELRSVNHRFFNPTIKLPGAFARWEGEVREALRKQVARGHVTVFARAERDETRGSSIDEVKFAQHVAQLRELQQRFSLGGELDIGTVLRMPEVFAVGEQEEDTGTAGELVAIVEEAARELTAMREQEGGRLAAFLGERIAVIETAVARIAERAPRRLVEQRDRLRAAVQDLAGGIALDDARLAQEIAVLADRMDVSEELDRFQSHIHAFRAALGEGATDGIGKRLGFLLQELLREANTTGSKAADAAMLQDVVAIKEELERIREQVENLE
ncbi:MAG TPA: YicC/YloC family endoribonuclease [Gemmatimonadaceae bacterium]|nr:YicC/YloC family endoribonuclease [Gemmatimonadaceae bacterium]